MKKTIILVPLTLFFVLSIMVPHSTSVAQEIGRPINNKPAQGTKTQTNNHYDVGKAIISPQTKDITKIKTQSPKAPRTTKTTKLV